ncbi:MAG: homoserine dehydrogenase [Nitrososphaerota archaeon]|nr:homoserine dehydrogenase [Nitrososphaerota archaeon]
MRIILVGFGVVGQSLARLLSVRKRELLGYGINPRVVAVVDSGGAAVDPKGVDLDAALAAKKGGGTVADHPRAGQAKLDALRVIRSVEAEVVVETTPTNIRDGEPGLGHMEASFRAGKHVVTANKGPLALALPALNELAAHNKVEFFFSGTVGGGTPILHFAKRCLSSDRILKIEGILNGTTNFILGRMESQGEGFDAALAEASEKGYAEADPSLDIDGWDTACKVVIMANWIMGKETTLADVDVKGIRGISTEEVRGASRAGRSVKLLGSIDDTASVRPVAIERTDPLCVQGTLNAVKFSSEFAGDEVIIGKGAGGMETASAVLRDLLELKRSRAWK